MSDPIARGEQARRILEDPLVVEALQALKEGVRDQFFALNPEAKEQREFLHLMDRARQQFERCFVLLISGAEVSRYELTEEANAQARRDAIRSRAVQR